MIIGSVAIRKDQSLTWIQKVILFLIVFLGSQIFCIHIHECTYVCTIYSPGMIQVHIPRPPITS